MLNLSFSSCTPPLTRGAPPNSIGVSRATARALILFLTGWCLFSSNAPASGQRILSVGDSSWRPGGLLCCRLVEDRGTTIQLVDLSGEQPAILFKRPILTPVKPPVCLTNAVIAVSTDGTINKIDLKGELVFGLKPAGFSGVSGYCGRVTDNHIFITETSWDARKKEWVYRLFIVNVSGKEPATTWESRIIQPLRVSRVIDEIVVVGVKKTQRLKLPKFIEQQSERGGREGQD